MYTIKNPRLTPLLWATFKGHVPIIKLLLNGGADVNSADAAGMTAVWLACLWPSDRVDMVQLFVEAGANLKMKCSQRFSRSAGPVEKLTPRQVASKFNHKKCVKALPWLWS